MSDYVPMHATEAQAAVRPLYGVTVPTPCRGRLLNGRPCRSRRVLTRRRHSRRGRCRRCARARYVPAAAATEIALVVLP